MTEEVVAYTSHPSILALRESTPVKTKTSIMHSRLERGVAPFWFEMLRTGAERVTNYVRPDVRRCVAKEDLRHTGRTGSYIM